MEVLGLNRGVSVGVNYLGLQPDQLKVDLRMVQDRLLPEVRYITHSQLQMHNTNSNP